MSIYEVIRVPNTRWFEVHRYQRVVIPYRLLLWPVGQKRDTSQLPRNSINIYINLQKKRVAICCNLTFSFCDYKHFESYYLPFPPIFRVSCWANLPCEWVIWMMTSFGLSLITFPRVAKFYWLRQFGCNCVYGYNTVQFNHIHKVLTFACTVLFFSVTTRAFVTKEEIRLDGHLFNFLLNGGLKKNYVGSRLVATFIPFFSTDLLQYTVL